MISLSLNQPIYLCTTPTDMRKSFCGLSGLVRASFLREPTDGSLFVFLNRRGDRVKILYWDRDGLALWCKRLERGCFERPAAPDGQACLQIDATELAMLLGGVSLQGAKRRRRRPRAA
jgi:transposase